MNGIFVPSLSFTVSGSLSSAVDDDEKKKHIPHQNNEEK